MPSCEKCWQEAGGDADVYTRLMQVRNCTPEEQAGPEATECPECKRRTVHQHCHICMNPACSDRRSATQSTTRIESDGSKTTGADLLDWAESHPELCMNALCSWWAQAGSGRREVRFSFRNVIKAAIEESQIKATTGGG